MSTSRVISVSGRAAICALWLLAEASVNTHDLLAQQIDIGRIDQMPNLPSPYMMRDWAGVAKGYDNFVFDFNRSGQYLPLVWRSPATVNYPEHGSFGLDTVVGTPREFSGEAINVLPAVVGASLVGIDKSNQNGEDWVLMTEEFFNRRPEENVYLNGPVTSSGNDWWYDTMPNVFFYQLYDLYPGTGDFEFQFRSVADRWLQAVEKMNGGTTPWTVPNMNYRAWSLSTMTGQSAGVKEPEAAGAIAWLLYNAFIETGEDQYRRGAEWAMEFLDGLSSNPSYELQLPYGAYAAARMNAELGTSYDVEKMVNWTFTVGPLRSWGALLGTWGGYDVHGLIGEDSSNDYAFMMNGFQQVGALVPLARYDDRFARAIGKWVLNVANASRLFYPNYLPAANQDSEEWADANDPESFIGHEALRQSQSSVSPYATGDAISGGWGYTNLALYASSHVGVLGAIVDTTNVDGILELDALKTDYFGDEAYPTHLYFNPYAVDTTVTIDLGAGTYDLFDLVSNQFVAYGAGGSTPVDLTADQAALLVRAPASGVVTYELNRMMIDGVTVDYRSSQTPSNYPPRIKGLDSDSRDVFKEDSTSVYCTAEDRDDAVLSFVWSTSGGLVVGGGPTILWKAPAEAGTFEIVCRVEDGRGGVASDTLSLAVFSNHRPVIDSVTANPPIVDVLESSTITCDASDVDGDLLSYSWDADAGSLDGDGASVSWIAPDIVGYYAIRCTVSDIAQAQDVDSIGVVAGHLVADLRFTGDTLDNSGFGNNAIAVGGPMLVSDRDGNPAAAYDFDGVDDALVVPTHPSLDFEDAITVSFWMAASDALNRESFPVSHGSWQNRWKVSIIPEQQIRWTIKTADGVTDLDSGVAIVPDSLYHVAGTYGDGTMRIYLNGSLRREKAWTGQLATTGHDLTVGQMLPGDTQYNFAGVIDDIVLYNRALSGTEILGLFNRPTGLDDTYELPGASRILAHYPNPFSQSTTIDYEIDSASEVTIKIYDIVGRHLRTLVSDLAPPGIHRVLWNGRDSGGVPVASGVYLVLFKAGDRIQKTKLVRLANS